MEVFWEFLQTVGIAVVVFTMFQIENRMRIITDLVSELERDETE